MTAGPGQEAPEQVKSTMTMKNGIHRTNALEQACVRKTNIILAAVVHNGVVEYQVDISNQGTRRSIGTGNQPLLNRPEVHWRCNYFQVVLSNAGM
jgi:hypothetical protein